MVAAMAMVAMVTLVGGCRRRFGGNLSKAPSAGPVAAQHVPRSTSALHVDGELDEPIWGAAQNRFEGFVDAAGALARPQSYAQLAIAEGRLYLGFFAADEVMESSDAFVVTVASKKRHARFVVGPKGLVRAPDEDSVTRAVLDGAEVGVDVDGTIDRPTDEDEEWLVELALPLAPLGLTGARGERATIKVERCDRPKAGGTSCGHLGTDAAPRALVFD